MEYNKFTHEQAVYGANNCGADWNAEALEKARSYMSMGGFTKSRLISQLEYNKFTHEQAVYGAEQAGATD